MAATRRLTAVTGPALQPAVGRLSAGHYRLFAITTAAAATATAAALLLWGRSPGLPFGIALVLLVLVLAGELGRHDLYGEATTSLEIVPIVAAGILGGPLWSVGVVLLMTFGQDAARHRLRLVTLFNAATLVLAGVAAISTLRVLSQVAFLGHGWGYLAAGLAAGAVYYACNEPVVALASVIETGRSFRAAYRERHAWLLPHYAAQGLLAAGLVVGARDFGALGAALFSMPALMATVASAQYVRRTAAMVAELTTANRSLATLLAQNRQLLEALGEQHLAIISGLARAIDAKDPYTAGHTERVACFAVLLADELGIPADQHGDIEHGSLLHDIGKIGVPDRVLQKSGPLDRDDWRAIRRHPEIACFILDGIDLPPAVLEIVRSHHENLDGTGYPDGLVSSQLTLPARIGRVADAFDAMTSTRPYRPALSVAAALAELRRCSGTQFCPAVVGAMEGLVERGDTRLPAPLVEPTRLAS